MTNYNNMEFANCMRIECDAPVLEICLDVQKTYPNGDKLPGIWITNPVQNAEGQDMGRTYTELYPSHDYDDKDGKDALYYGSNYYDEAMSYVDSADRQKRVDCFRAAEILYRHAAGRGNPVAHLCLGYVYSYDRCDGHYWSAPLGAGTVEDNVRPFPFEERAFQCFSLAAEAGIPEACYKLGDMYKHGIGCSPDSASAFRWYARASELTAREHPVILGSVALRLAGCYEEGFGCSQDFARALEWYRRAAAGLEAAVEAGESWYAKALAGARAGVKRCEQEVVPSK